MGEKGGKGIVSARKYIKKRAFSTTRATERVEKMQRQSTALTESKTFFISSKWTVKNVLQPENHWKIISLTSERTRPILKRCGNQLTHFSFVFFLLYLSFSLIDNSHRYHIYSDMRITFFLVSASAALFIAALL